jgi:hypothetical protein
VFSCTEKSGQARENSVRRRVATWWEPKAVWLAAAWAPGPACLGWAWPKRRS